MQHKIEIVIGIPGKWQTRSDIVTSIAGESDGLLFAGAVLTNTATNEPYRLEVYDHDPNLTRAFAIGGRQSLTELDLESIQSHTYTLCLIAEGGTFEQAQKVLDIGCGLLKAGGLALKVETTGKAHSRQDWFALAAAKNETALCHAFVTLVGKGSAYYSCGMHNLGYRDAIVRGNITPDDAARLLQAFLFYILIERPSIIDGHTFSEDQHSPHYRLLGIPCESYPGDHTFHNPYGMWQLEAVGT